MIDTWVIWNLTGGADGGVHVTDVTNASRTLLMDLRTLDWDDELLALFGIPRRMLPAIKSSSDRQGYGVTRRNGPVGAEVPVCGDLGDQQAATVGQVCFSVGEAKNTYGTGNFMLLNTGETPTPSKTGLLTTVCYKLGDAAPVYALEGSVAVTGSAVQWLRDQLGIIATAAEVEALANTVPDNGGAYFVPAFSGLFAPYWRSDARGAIVGLSRFNTKGHLARATLEAICFQTRAVLDAMTIDSGVKLAVAESGRRRNRERHADAAAGRRAGCAGRPAGRCGDDRAGRGVCRRPCGRLLEGSRDAAEQLARRPAMGTGLEHGPPRGIVSRVAEGRGTHAELGRLRRGDFA